MLVRGELKKITLLISDAILGFNRWHISSIERIISYRCKINEYRLEVYSVNVEIIINFVGTKINTSLLNKKLIVPRRQE